MNRAGKIDLELADALGERALNGLDARVDVELKTIERLLRAIVDLVSEILGHALGQRKLMRQIVHDAIAGGLRLPRHFGGGVDGFPSARRRVVEFGIQLAGALNESA